MKTSFILFNRFKFRLQDLLLVSLVILGFYIYNQNTITSKPSIKPIVPVTPYRELRFKNSDFTFNYKPNSLVATGILKFDVEGYADFPHSLKVQYHRSTGYCTTRLLISMAEGNKDFIDVDEYHFKITKWNDEQITAEYKTVQGSKDTLKIDIPNKLVVLVTTEINASNQSKPVKAILTDGKDKFINKSNLTWRNK